MLKVLRRIVQSLDVLRTDVVDVSPADGVLETLFLDV